MNKLLGLAFVAALSLGALSTTAEAARTFPKPPPTSTTDNVSDLCTTLCIQIPPPPPDCGQPHRGTIGGLKPLSREFGTITIDPPPPSTTCGSKGTAALQDCGDKLGNLRRVTIGQVRRIDENDKVHIVPLCDTVNRSLTEQQWNYLARGNVQGLIPAIDDNDTLMAELEDRGYEANDVLGIALAPDAAILYVSRHR